MAQTLTVNLDDEDAELLASWSQTTGRSASELVSRSLRQTIPTVPNDASPRLRREMLAVRQLPDPEVRKIAESRLEPGLQTEISALLEINRRGELTGEQDRRLEELLRLGDDLTLKKSWAYLILKERGLETPVP